MIAYAKQIAYSTEETLWFSYEMGKFYKDVDACFVECGVAAGAQIIMMRQGAPNKLVHAFDSFMGIPQPSNRDNQIPGIRYLNAFEQSQLPNPGEQELKTSGVTAVTVDSFKTHLIDSGCGIENIVIHEGWFEETIPKAEVGDIAILRLDGDLYNSTFVSLKHLFPKVIRGGVVILDDYELQGCLDACKEYFEFINYTPDWKKISNIGYFVK